jgi:hypothetical protein
VRFGLQSEEALKAAFANGALLIDKPKVCGKDWQPGNHITADNNRCTPWFGSQHCVMQEGNLVARQNVLSTMTTAAGS